MTDRKKKLLAPLLLLSIAVQCMYAVLTKSPVNDEPAHIPTGFYNWKTGDFNMGMENPPIVKLIATFPLLFSNLHHGTERVPIARELYSDYFENFLYANRLPAETILVRARIPIILLSLLLGYFVFAWSSQLYGMNSGIFALFLYSFSPDILAHSSIATTDLGVGVFMFIAVYFLWKYLASDAKKFLLATGILLGFSLASKFTSLALLPSYLLIILLYPVLSGKGKKVRGHLGDGILIMLIAAVSLSLCYGIVSLPDYFYGLAKQARLVSGGHPSFFMGKFSQNGWRQYFLVAFLVKNTLPVVILTILSVILLFRKKEINTNLLFLLIPAFLVFASSSLSRKQIGLRYILPVYPFLFVWMSRLINEKIKFKGALLVLLCAWQVFSAFRTAPHYLAYFNELAGGPDNGPRWLLDSNIDWGQDLKGLKKYLDGKGVNKVIFSYSGTSKPENWGIISQDLLSTLILKPPTRHINPVEGGKEYLAVSVNNLHGIFYSDTTVFNWLKVYKPCGKIGHTIYVYDITGDGNAHYNMANLYLRVDRPDEARREFAMAEHCRPR